MNPDETITLASEFMRDFARQTGLNPVNTHPRRYLWTDAFAVCNYLELFRQTNNETYCDLALRLVDQVHHTLGWHREDDDRTGWISGLPAGEGRLHPTIGGLRIGKTLPERGEDEPYNEQREWDQDGQYYHYLTKWMHALNRISMVTGNPDYLTWAIELAQTAQSKFTYYSPATGKKRMYWKMSIDLARPLVPSMGQHDPLDGFVTCYELQETAKNFRQPVKNVLEREIADMTGICREIHLFTDDPLGIGGLLFDASRITRLTLHGGKPYAGLLEALLGSALTGLDSFTGSGSLELPARHRLAFREFGVSIGLAGVVKMQEIIGNNPDLPGRTGILQQRVNHLLEYVPLREKIQQFWLEENNRKTGSWTEHREINTVMLATSLAPEGFLEVS